MNPPCDGGTYLVPAQINDAVTVKFVLDSGAADVTIPQDVVLTLFRGGSLADRDFVGTQTYVLANGSKLPSPRFLIHSLRVGNHVVRNVVASVAPVEADPLLGQSFLSKLPAWTFDNARELLILSDEPSRTKGNQPVEHRAIPAGECSGRIGYVTGLDPHADNSLSVREGPPTRNGLAHEIDKLFTEDPVCVAGADGNWLHVQYIRSGTAKTGWVHSHYIRLGGSPALPMAEPPPSRLVQATPPQWIYSDAQCEFYCGYPSAYVFVLRNTSQQNIKNIKYVVIFYGSDGAPIQSVEGTLEDTLLAGLAKTMTSDLGGNAPYPGHEIRKGARKAQVRILDYEFAEPNRESAR